MRISSNCCSLLFVIFSVFSFLLSCERPNSPDFKVEHNVKTPLLAEERLYFLGGEDAIIDTTSSEFDSLFSVSREGGVDSGLVSLSQEQDISLGDFEDALPSIQSNPRHINSQLGTINGQAGEDTEAELGNFQPDFDGSGHASFQEVVGNSPPSGGQPIPGGSSTVRIPLETENFVSATIEGGAIEVVFQNNLGFDISNLEIQLYSNTDENGTAVGSRITNNTVITHGESYTDQIQFESGDRLEVDLEAEVFIEWNGQPYTATSNPSIEVQVSDDNLVVSQATSDVSEQNLNPDTPNIMVGGAHFEHAILTENNREGTLNQLDIQVTNNTNLPLTNNDRTAPPALTLRNSDNEVLDRRKSMQVEGRPNATQVESGETATVRFDLSGETLTRAINYDLELGTSGGSGLQINSDDKVLIQSSTTELEVDEARLEMDSENLETGNSLTLDTQEFQFTRSDHYVELGGGTLVIDSLVNQLSLNIPELEVKIKDIFTPDGDTLSITFEGTSDGPAGSYQYRRIESNENNDREPIRIDLTGFRIKALNNQIEYVVSGRTEDTGNQAVTVRSSDEVGAKMQVEELEVKEARGVIAEKDILLNEDDPVNGENVLDLFNDREAEVQEFDDLEELSDRIGETQFFDTAFDLLYDVNLGFPVRVYGIIVGINEEGDRVYLRPKQGGQYAVDNPQMIQELQIDGQPADPERVLKLPIESADQMGDIYRGAINFEQTSTNVDDFLSNFPTTIRFIGKAVTNPPNNEGFVVTPIDFNSSVGFEIPIQFANSAGSQVLNDTVDADLSDLPGENESTILQRSAVSIQYENMLPMKLELTLTFLDERDSVITAAPASGDNPAVVEAPDVDLQTRFVSSPAEGEMVVGLTDEQAQKLHKTRKIILQGNFITSSGPEGRHRVKIRKDDYFEFTLIGDFKIQNEVSN